MYRNKCNRLTFTFKIESTNSHCVLVTAFRNSPIYSITLRLITSIAYLALYMLLLLIGVITLILSQWKSYLRDIIASKLYF